MSLRTRPPFRADHVGNLLHPPSLLKASEDLARGAMSAEALRTAEGNPLTIGEQFAKLKLVAETAREVWGTA